MQNPNRTLLQLITIDKSFLTGKIHTLPRSIMEKVEDGVRLILKL